MSGYKTRPMSSLFNVSKVCKFTVCIVSIKIVHIFYSLLYIDQVKI